MKTAGRVLPYLLAMTAMLVLRDFTLDNELKYLSIADEALANGHFFAFYNHGVPYADKPPLYFWIIMACRVIFGRHLMFPLALFSALPALMTTSLLGKWMAEDGGVKDAAALEMLLMGSFYFLCCALVVRMDMLMTFFILAAMYCFFRIYSGNESAGYRWAFPVFVFLAVFTKGPVGIIIPLIGTTAFLAAKGELKRWPRIWNAGTWAVLAALCLIWFYLTFLEGGKEYLNNLLVHQTVGRAVDSFAHKEPFWYYVPALLYAFLPWSPLAVYIIGWGAFKRRIRTDLEKYLFWVTVSFLLVMSLFSSKLQIYLLPVYPFIAALAVLLLPSYCEEHPGVDRLHKNGRLRKILKAYTLGIYILLFAVGLSAPLYNDMIGVRKLCDAAADECESDSGIKGYAAYKFAGAMNMDAVLDAEVIPVEEIGEAVDGYLVFVENSTLKAEPETERMVRSVRNHIGRRYSYFIYRSPSD